MARFISSMFVASAALIGLIAFPISGAKADTVWTLSNVLFDDGATATGTFTVNVYGYLTESSISVATTSGTTLAGDIYNATFVAGNINNVGGTGLPDNTVQFFSSTVGYEGDAAIHVHRCSNWSVGTECYRRWFLGSVMGMWCRMGLSSLLWDAYPLCYGRICDRFCGLDRTCGRYATPSRAAALRYWPRRVWSAWLAQKAEKRGALIA